MGNASERGTQRKNSMVRMRERNEIKILNIGDWRVFGGEPVEYAEGSCVVCWAE